MRLNLSNCRNVSLWNLMMVHLVVLESFIVHVLKIVVLWMLCYQRALSNSRVFVVVTWLFTFAWKASHILVIHQFRMGIELSHKWRRKRRLSLSWLRNRWIVLVATWRVRQVDLPHLSTKRVCMKYSIRCTLVWGITSKLMAEVLRRRSNSCHVAIFIVDHILRLQNWLIKLLLRQIIVHIIITQFLI